MPCLLSLVKQGPRATLNREYFFPVYCTDTHIARKCYYMSYKDDVPRIQRVVKEKYRNNLRKQTLRSFPTLSFFMFAV